MLTAVEPDGDSVVVRFAVRRGTPTEVEDRIPLTPRGEMASVRGVGRVVRILRAGRIQIPRDPYRYCSDARRTAELLRRATGTLVQLVLARRIERVLTLWLEAGVERIRGVLDYGEDDAGLWIQRRGGQSRLLISRHHLIRYEPSSQESYEVISVENPPRLSLQ